MEKKYIMAIDQGTTGSRVLFFDRNAELVSLAYRELTQIFPQPGWVEHNAMEQFETVEACMHEAMAKANIKFEEIAGIGMTNQRETAVMWYKDSGKPVYNAIVWQSRQSTPICDEWIAKGYGPIVQQKTALPIDAFFSASKVVWIIENVPGVREEVLKGNVCFGNVDSWLYWNFSKGGTYAEDASNCSRSMMFNISTLEWDKELIHEVYGIPEELNFPKAVQNIGILGYTHPDVTGGVEIPFGGGFGDQQSGTFGQTAFAPLTGKITYGTAGVIDVNIGDKIVHNDLGIPTALGWVIENKPTYLQEVFTFNCGAMIQWLRDGIKILPSAPDSGPIAETVPDTKDVYIVPANNGLFYPMDPYARTIFVGITGGVTEAHIIRATLEGIAFSLTDCIRATEKTLGRKLNSLNLDGGACQCDFMMQFQADMFGFPLNRPTQIEMTALGAAYAGGIAIGFWTMDEVSKFWKLDRTFEPRMSEDEREERYAQWQRAVSRAKGWADRSKP